MRQLFLLILLLFALCGTASAQLQETFTDGDFTQNPTWTGDVASFQVNAAKQLQSKMPGGLPGLGGPGMQLPPGLSGFGKKK